MITPPHHIIDLTEAAIKGDAKAISMVFESFKPVLYALALRTCGNTPTAQESLQETFIQAYTHLPALRNPAAIYPWLKKILLNSCYKQIRKENSRLKNLQSTPKEMFIRNSIEEHFEHTANQQRIHLAMSRLSEELNSCILLRYFSDFTGYEDISAILGIPVGTVRSRLAAAKDKLSILYRSLEDAGEEALIVSRSWSSYYQNVWLRLYDDGLVRAEFYKHMHPKLNIRFTSGKKALGRTLIENEISDDLHYGTRFNVQEVVSSGNISIVQGINTFTPGYPNRCAPNSVFVLVRQKEKIGQLHIYDAPRPEKQ